MTLFFVLFSLPLLFMSSQVFRNSHDFLSSEIVVPRGARFDLCQPTNGNNKNNFVRETLQSRIFEETPPESLCARQYTCVTVVLHLCKSESDC